MLLLFFSCWMLAAEDECSGAAAADELVRRGVATLLPPVDATLLAAFVFGLGKWLT